MYDDDDDDDDDDDELFSRSKINSTTTMLEDALDNHRT
jgi:hypothetical protein